jgi:hypothetical protein
MIFAQAEQKLPAGLAKTRPLARLTWRFFTRLRKSLRVAWVVLRWRLRLVSRQFHSGAGRTTRISHLWHELRRRRVGTEHMHEIENERPSCFRNLDQPGTNRRDGIRSLGKSRSSAGARLGVLVRGGAEIAGVDEKGHGRASADSTGFRRAQPPGKHGGAGGPDRTGPGCIQPNQALQVGGQEITWRSGGWQKPRLSAAEATPRGLFDRAAGYYPQIAMRPSPTNDPGHIERRFSCWNEGEPGYEATL